MAFAPPADVAASANAQEVALEDEATGVAAGSNPATVRAMHSKIAESFLATNSISEAEYDGEHETPDWFGPALAAGLDPLHGQLANINALLVNISARQVNSIASDNTDTLEALLVTNGAAGVGPPGGFPATLGELDNLTGQQLAALLTFYGRPAGGTVDERRRRFKKHIGIGSYL